MTLLLLAAMQLSLGAQTGGAALLPLPGRGLAQHPFLYCGEWQRRSTSDLGKVVEYAADGNEIWSVAAPAAWAAVRLKNGNTLISGNRNGYVREVNHLPSIPLYTVQEVSRLSNGNTLINNWVGSVPQEEWPKVVQLIEVTRDKKVVWALRDWTLLGPASSTQLLDQRGAAARRER